LIVVGQYGDTRRRMPLLEELNLSNCRLEIIAGIDNEQDRLVSR
jgi:hypothetical protein